MVSMDYLIVTKAGVFTKEEGVERSEILMKILVLKDSQSKYVGAHVVPVKGLGEDRYAAERVRRDIMWLGYAKVILKADNEPALVQLVGDALRGLRVQHLDSAAAEGSVPYDPQTAGAAESRC